MSPYINKAHRPAYGAVLDALPDEFTATWPGDVAYLLTQILLRYVGDTAVGYSSHAMVLGILESVKLEYCRRVLAPYEDEARDRNGEVFK